MNTQQSAPILVIDDDPDQYELTRTILELEGYRVLTADNAETGLAIYERHHPFIVISDFSMPGMDGAELIKHLRSSATNGSALLPVIVISAHSADYINKHVNLSFPPDLILPKPVDFDLLLAAVKAYHQQHCRLHQLYAA